MITWAVIVCLRIRLCLQSSLQSKDRSPIHTIALLCPASLGKGSGVWVKSLRAHSIRSRRSGSSRWPQAVACWLFGQRPTTAENSHCLSGLTNRSHGLIANTTSSGLPVSRPCTFENRRAPSVRRVLVERPFPAFRTHQHVQATATGRNTGPALSSCSNFSKSGCRHPAVNVWIDLAHAAWDLIGRPIMQNSADTANRSACGNSSRKKSPAITSIRFTAGDRICLRTRRCRYLRQIEHDRPQTRVAFTSGDG